MGVFADTGVFVAAANKRDKNHAAGRSLLEAALKGEHGVLYTSDYVVDEIITTALARTHNHAIAINAGRLIMDSPRIEKLYTGPDEFKDAWKRFQAMRKKPMSFTDCVTLSHMEKRGLEKLMSFDSEFDGLVTRLH
jgi:predicted nucleic acid-binding protein